MLFAELGIALIHINMRKLHIEEFIPVRTNIEIDDQLIHKAMRSSGVHTKKAAVEAGLQLLVRTHSQAAIRRLRGKVRWEGDLSESRRGRARE